MEGNSVFILCVDTRRTVANMREIHDSPVNACIWYEKGQFFVTACQQGLIRCYNIIHKTIKGNSNSLGVGCNEDVEDTAVALLHTFSLHIRSVTAIRLHPNTPGLMISGSLDATIRVLNLEQLNQLFVVKVASGIMDISIISRQGLPSPLSFLFPLSR